MGAPRFIVLEGVEGSGKSTQIRLLDAWLDSLGLQHVRAREPGGTHVGEAIRHVLLHGGEEEEMPAETELLLMLAARAAFVREVVRPALEAGSTVLADRFDFSTFAYQGHGRRLPLDRIRELNRFATGGLVPDLVVVLDLPPELGRERQAREGKTLDRIERAGPGFMERVRAGYRALADSEGNAQMIDGRGTPEEVHFRLRTLLESSFPETFRHMPV